MKLSEILNGISDLKAKGNVDIEISDIACDSRKVKPESLFVAVKGYDVDGHDYIEEAIEKIKQETRRYAKRQITWFKRIENLKWLDGLEKTQNNIKIMVKNKL